MNLAVLVQCNGPIPEQELLSLLGNPKVVSFKTIILKDPWKKALISLHPSTSPSYLSSVYGKSFKSPFYAIVFSKDMGVRISLDSRLLDLSQNELRHALLKVYPKAFDIVVTNRTIFVNFTSKADASDARNSGQQFIRIAIVDATEIFLYDGVAKKKLRNRESVQIENCFVEPATDNKPPSRSRPTGDKKKVKVKKPVSTSAKEVPVVATAIKDVPRMPSYASAAAPKELPVKANDLKDGKDSELPVKANGVKDAKDSEYSEDFESFDELDVSKLESIIANDSDCDDPSNPETPELLQENTTILESHKEVTDMTTENSDEIEHFLPNADSNRSDETLNFDASSSNSAIEALGANFHKEDSKGDHVVIQVEESITESYSVSKNELHDQIDSIISTEKESVEEIKELPHSATELEQEVKSEVNFDSGEASSEIETNENKSPIQLLEFLADSKEISPHDIFELIDVRVGVIITLTGSFDAVQGNSERNMSKILVHVDDDIEVSRLMSTGSFVASENQPPPINTTMHLSCIDEQVCIPPRLSIMDIRQVLKLNSINSKRIDLQCFRKLGDAGVEFRFEINVEESDDWTLANHDVLIRGYRMGVMNTIGYAMLPDFKEEYEDIIPRIFPIGHVNECRITGQGEEWKLLIKFSNVFISSLWKKETVLFGNSELIIK